uniref:Uncharacterized protein n=1 Tax=Panagrolaimus superbus TaxID=310955 RepID=A0A914YFD5_9BILA
MNVIDRSSTLTQLMIPGSKKKNAELEGLSQDPEDLDSLLASLPPEYLAAISANVDFEEKIEHVSLSEVIPRRPSPIKSPNKISTNGFKEADLPLKDTNGFGEKRKANNRLSLSPPKAKKSKLVDDDDDHLLHLYMMKK